MKKIIIGVSLGDPAGIGPEVFIKAFPKINKIKNFYPLLIGDTVVVEKTFKSLGVRYSINILKNIDDFQENSINIYNTNIILNEDFPIGIDSKICGNASFTYLQESVNLWKKQFIQGLVTLPISKKAWHLANRFYSGHTEFLAFELKAEKYAMIMIADKLRVILVTTHIPLKDVASTLTKQLIIEKISTSFQFLNGLGIKKPNIIVSGLNPHAGEGEVLGTEEENIIKPAISYLNKNGIKCKGPLPPDTVYKYALEKKADLIVAMYHDQALIPLKTFFFDKLVNYTAGLKIVRTSPGHGTGFDISYKNKSNPNSFIEAYKTNIKFLTSKTPQI